jgi:ribosome-binding factor A
MYQALLPSKTMSVLSEYKILLIDFLGKVYDMPDIPELVRKYDYDSEHMNRMVKVLEHEGRN